MICGLESIYRLISSRNGKWKQIVSMLTSYRKLTMMLWSPICYLEKSNHLGYNISDVRKEQIMTTAELIRELCKKQNISIAELARRIGQTRQNLYKKLQRDTLTIDEVKQIADALGVKFEQSFTLPDGVQYKIEN